MELDSNHDDLNRCPTDGPVGAALMLLAGLGAVATILLASVLAALFGGFVSPAQPTITMSPNLNMGSPIQAPQSSGGPSLVAFLAFGIPLAICCVAFFCGLGICHGLAWAFQLGIVLFALVTLAGNGAAVLGIAVAAYCVLRLLRVIGPAPANP